MAIKSPAEKVESFANRAKFSIAVEEVYKRAAAETMNLTVAKTTVRITGLLLDCIRCHTR
jgi:hypothetical protein